MRLWIASCLLVSGCFNPDDGGGSGSASATGTGSTGSEGTSAGDATTPGTVDDDGTNPTPGSNSLDSTSEPTVTATDDGPTDDTADTGGTETGVVEMCGDGLFDPASPPFGEPVQIAMLANTQGVAIADIDDDGDNDVVLGDFGDGDPTVAGVYVMLGHGDGTFDSPTQLPGGGIPTVRVAAAPIADATVDVVAIVGLPPNFTIAVRRWRGNGDGTFLAPNDYPATSNWDVALGDVDGDDRRDLLGTDGGGVLVSLGTAGETFGAPQTIAGAGSGIAVKAGDVDGDGDIDVLANGMNSIQLWLSQGGGTFAPVVDYPIAGADGMADVATADFDGDGLADIAGASGSIVSVRPGDGAADFGDEIQLTVQGSVLAAAVPDVDVDGCADVIVGNNTGTVSLVMSLGAGEFVDQVIYNIGPDDYFYDLDAGDLDGDQIADIVGVTAGGAPDGGGRIWALFSGG